MFDARYHGVLLFHFIWFHFLLLILRFFSVPSPEVDFRWQITQITTQECDSHGIVNRKHTNELNEKNKQRILNFACWNRCAFFSCWECQLISFIVYLHIYTFAMTRWHTRRQQRKKLLYFAFKINSLGTVHIPSSSAVPSYAQTSKQVSQRKKKKQGKKKN